MSEMKCMRRRTIRKFGFIILTTLFSIKSTAFAAENWSQMRLADDLDFPSEGYCIDVIGVGRTARIDLPLVLHNCLPTLDSVDRIALEQKGRIYMPAFDACVTALGIRKPLPGVPLLLRKCGGNENFFDISDLQQFNRTTKNQLQLTGTNLCLTGGRVADRTYSPTHRWRTLTLEICSEAPTELSTWR